MNKTLRSCLLFLPAVLCCILIFCFSAQTAAESRKTSNGFIEWTLSALDPEFSQLPSAERTVRVQSLSSVTRKCAHGTIYMLFGVLLVLPLAALKRLTLSSAALGWLFCVFYAVIDELHQYFVAGRSCELRDICIDAAGALIGILFVYLIHLLRRRRDKAHTH